MAVVIAFQFFENGTAYSRRNISDGSHGEYNIHLSLGVLFDAGS